MNNHTNYLNNFPLMNGYTTSQVHFSLHLLYHINSFKYSFYKFLKNFSPSDDLRLKLVQSKNDTRTINKNNKKRNSVAV